jgi:hypothetical protein
MSVNQTPSFEQWLLLGVFFVLFAIYGFTKSTQGSGCRPCYYIFIGILAVAANSLVLLMANRSGIDDFNLLHLIMLKQTTIESSFIVLGYCLIVQGIAMLIRWLFLPASIRASRNLL